MGRRVWIFRHGDCKGLQGLESVESFRECDKVVSRVNSQCFRGFGVVVGGPGMGSKAGSLLRIPKNRMQVF